MRNLFKIILAFMCLLLGALVLAQTPETIIVGTVYNIFHEEFSTDAKFFAQVQIGTLL